ncbi:hypothetical protein [Lactococcus lactis]|uniref:hypothetical protein n=1 Tax=Lactococcus lactis TaxID=1358 RepID=UPI0028917D2F|nr:hypothetical protein [Lactococcus lactis]MDT2887960.1 hypothetical protein [Lactococcus lactis]MDT2930740.1 hypothetical protein [Lactococcus lactis]
MKKTLISVFAITSLVTVSLVALKCRLKPPKKEVFNFEEPLKEEEQEVLDENRQLKYDTQNKIEEIKLQIDVLSDLCKKFPSKPDQFEERILSSYDTKLRIALNSTINAMDIVQLFLDSTLQKKTSNSPNTVLNSISVNIKEIALHLSIYDSFYPLKEQFSLRDIISRLSETLEFMEDAESVGMLLSSSSAEFNQYGANDKGLQNSEKKDENIPIIGNTEGGQKEFLEPNIHLKSSPEQLYVYQDFSHSLGDVILSNQLKIEDVPQELRLLGGSQLYQKAWLHSRKHSDVEQYVLTLQLLLNDVKSFKGNGVWTRGEARRLVLEGLINGLDLFNEDKSLIDFIAEQKNNLEDIGILYDPDYSSVFSKEKIRKDENEEDDFFSEKAKIILSNKAESNKAEIKVLGYIIRQVIRSHEKGINVVVFKYSNYLKKARNSFEYLVKHLDEIEQSPKVLRVKVTAFYIAIYFERK